MATLATYTLRVQRLADDESDDRKDVIETMIQDRYQEIMSHAGHLLIESSDDIQLVPVANTGITTDTYYDTCKIFYRNVGDTNWKALKEMSRKEILDDQKLTTGEPRFFYRDGDKIKLFPEINQNVEVRIKGVKVPPRLEGSIVSVLPDRWRHVLIDGVMASFKLYQEKGYAPEYRKYFHGSFGNQGRLDGELAEMLRELGAEQSYFNYY